MGRKLHQTASYLAVKIYMYIAAALFLTADRIIGKGKHGRSPSAAAARAACTPCAACTACSFPAGQLQRHKGGRETPPGAGEGVVPLISEGLAFLPQPPPAPCSLPLPLLPHPFPLPLPSFRFCNFTSLTKNKVKIYTTGLFFFLRHLFLHCNSGKLS